MLATNAAGIRQRLLPLVAVAALGPVGDAMAAIPARERNALVALYNSTNGPAWMDKGGWLGAPGTECTWYGVTCDAGGTTVLALNLWGAGLSGPLPAQLGNLSNLRDLQLGENSLRGPIPLELANLSALEGLHLGSDVGLPPIGPCMTQLTGSIPPQLGNLVHLKYLSLSCNKLSGSIPAQLGNLPNLVGLGLSGNLLTGRIPPALGSLRTLQSLELAYNQLSGPIPAQFGNLSALTRLELNWNQLSGVIPPELSHLSNLRTLLLDSNQLIGSVPPQLVNLWSLQYAKLWWNALHAEDPTLIAFLDMRGGAWRDQQTVAPSNLRAIATSSTSVTLLWTPIAFTGGGGGGYRVYRSPSPTGPFTLAVTTADKLASSAVVGGLAPGATYYFAVDTFTRAEGTHNQSTVYSELSAPVLPTPLRLLTVTTVGAGKVTSNPSGIDCGSTCAANYPSGMAVTLNATADPGALFAGWSGDCSGTDTSFALTMSAARACTATFMNVIATRSKAVSGGPFTPGGPVHYTITIATSGPSAQADNPGHELIDVLPAELDPVSASTTSGTAAIDGNTVSWDGALASGASVTIGIDATLKASVPFGTVVSNQAEIHYDANADGTNEAVILTDDPGSAGSTDPTTFAVLPAMGFYTLTPCRLVDTRASAGMYGGPALVAGNERVFALRGQCGIPSTALAVSLNVTVTQSTQIGHVVLYASDRPRPNVSAVNYLTGTTKANNAVVTLGPSGGLAAFCSQASGTAHVVIDVNGYFE